MSEDTGLLRVGDASKRVRYVPANTTTVVRRIKPPTDSDDEQASVTNQTYAAFQTARKSVFPSSKS